MECLKIKDLTCGLGISLPSDCDKALCRVNDVLRRHYIRMIGTETTRNAIRIPGPGIHTLQTDNGHDIYRLSGVYVRPADGCFHNDCFVKIQGCSECEDWRYLKISKGTRDLGIGQYTMDGDKITLNVGPDILDGYIEYSMGPRKLESLDQKICIDSIQIEALQQGFLRFEAEMNKDFEAANYFEQKEFQSIQKIKDDKEGRIPYSIGGLPIPN